MNSQQNPIIWFEIYVADMDRARTFYQNCLQVRMQEMPNPEVEMWSFPMAMEAPGAAGALVRMAGKDPGVGGTLVYFSCADCAVEAGRAGEHGGKVCREKFPIGEYGHLALIHDTEGNLIGLHSMR